ncbi:MAG: KGK domain-containing protein [Coleofasciculaceae cyanobacterium]
MSEPLNLDQNDVVSVDTTQHGWVVIQNKTFKVAEFNTNLNGYLQGGGTAKEMLLGEGLPCEVLKPSSNWQKGKVKIRLEFCPDEPISPLDDIRQSLQAES